MRAPRGAGQGFGLGRIADGHAVEEKWGKPVRTGGGGFIGVWALYKNGMRVRYEDTTGTDRQSTIHDAAISRTDARDAPAILPRPKP